MNGDICFLYFPLFFLFGLEIRGYFLKNRVFACLTNIFIIIYSPVLKQNNGDEPVLFFFLSFFLFLQMLFFFPAKHILGL